jgi:hypothetical protein
LVEWSDGLSVEKSVDKLETDSGKTKTTCATELIVPQRLLVFQAKFFLFFEIVYDFKLPLCKSV